ATTQNGYILPVAITLVYAFLGSIIVSINMYIHPLSSMAVIVARNGDIPGLNYTQVISIPMAFLGIFIWGIVSVLLANVALARK
ncbi:ABC transporter permease, partial [Bacillus subtilis]